MEIHDLSLFYRMFVQVQLVFYSTFEPMVLPIGGPMEAIGVQKLYSPSPTPILYVGLAANVLGWYIYVIDCVNIPERR